MSILNKILTAVRGGAREVGEAIMDANGTRIFEQEIHDSKEHLKRAKCDLTDVMAKQMQSAREIAVVKSAIVDHEGYALEALAKENETLAIEIAEKVARKEDELEELEGLEKVYGAHVVRLKELVRKTERQIKDYERQLSMVKTTESVQKATAAITDNFVVSNAKLLGAKESLERIQKKQLDFDDKLKAAELIQQEEVEKTLEDKMEAEGIGKVKSTGVGVLERIKAQRGG
ncbi:phage shock protein A [Gammaproteobacteria bacterium 45_16_T64]|nr:phage shock protein A [Gammaproteobacteria bacterium 45_16_T64]